MDLNLYQSKAKSFIRFPQQSTSGALSYCLLALCGEAGEAANIWKKILRASAKPKLTEDTRKKLLDELGDVLWYVAAAATVMGASLDDIGRLNLRKLADRYKETEK